MSGLHSEKINENRRDDQMNIIKKIANWLDIKKISFMAGCLFLMSMLPNWLLAFIARPSGDDYGYSAMSHQAWVHTHSVLEVIKASLEMTKQMCQTWNGDWFSVFIFTLMPEVFVYRSFWIVPVFWTLAVIGATYYAAHEILTRCLGFKRHESILVTAVVLVMFYQWIPSSGIGMYWYVGVIHYMMPHVVAMLLIGFLFKYLRTARFRYIIFSAIGMIAIGGSSYYSSFLILLSYLLLIVSCIWKDKRVGWFGLPIITGGIALYFQISAPGNAGRIEEQIEFSFGKAICTVIESLWRSALVIVERVKETPLLVVIMILTAIIIWECLSEAKFNFKFRYPILWTGYMYGIYASMFAPEVYAATEISGGPPTMEYLTFILAAVSSMIYIEGWIIQKLKEKKMLRSREQYHLYVTLPAIIVCMFLCICFRGNLKNTLFYISCDYIASGQAADFKEQMESQEKILLDESIKEAYLCPTNEEQGPLMHMPVVSDPDAFTNYVVGRFYGKDYVTTME